VSERRKRNCLDLRVGRLAPRGRQSIRPVVVSSHETVTLLIAKLNSPRSRKKSGRRGCDAFVCQLPQDFGIAPYDLLSFSSSGLCVLVGTFDLAPSLVRRGSPSRSPRHVNFLFRRSALQLAVGILAMARHHLAAEVFTACSRQDYVSIHIWLYPS